jgi:hypothetical protein
MLNVLYIHLKASSLFIRDKPVLTLERILPEKYDRNGSAAKKKALVMNIKRLGAKMN